MSKLIATLVAGLISVSAFATTPAATSAPATTPTAVQKPAAVPAKEVKKAAHEVAHKTTEKAATPSAKTTATIK